jgi:hypothetical protein
MDCKKVQRAISELDDFDLQSLNSILRKHLSMCPSCSDTFKWVETVYRHLKSVPLSDPGEEFWEGLNRKVQIDLMVGGMESERRNWWTFGPPAWMKVPALACGIAAAAVALVIVFWGVSPQQWPGLKWGTTPQVELAARPEGPESCQILGDDETGSHTALDTLTKEELNTCVRTLISNGLETREIAEWAGDSIILAGTDMAVESNIRYLGRRELERLSYLLNQRYPR